MSKVMIIKDNKDINEQIYIDLHKDLGPINNRVTEYHVDTKDSTAVTIIIRD